MLTYDTYYCSSWMGDDYYELRLKWNNEIIGCIYHYTNTLAGKHTPEIHFDKWRHYKDHEKELPTFCPKELAEQAILEYHLLT